MIDFVVQVPPPLSNFSMLIYKIEYYSLLGLQIRVQKNIQFFLEITMACSKFKKNK